MTAPTPSAEAFSAAYAKQEADETARTAAGAEAVGYKVACTNTGAQKFVGVTEPCYARLYATDLIQSPGAIAVKPGWPCAIECELALIAARDAAPDEDLRQVIGALSIAIEVVEDRYNGISEAGGATLVADRFAHRAFLLGPRHPFRGQALDRFEAEVTIDGRVVERGRSDSVLGHPINSITWLQQALARRGRVIKAGEVILTGSIAPPHWVKTLPAAVTCSLSDGLGSLNVRLFSGDH